MPKLFSKLLLGQGSTKGRGRGLGQGIWVLKNVYSTRRLKERKKRFKGILNLGFTVLSTDLKCPYLFYKQLIKFLWKANIKNIIQN